MRSRASIDALGWMAALSLLLCAAGTMAAEKGAPKAPATRELRVGVAPFENGSPAATVPDVAALLADRLAALGAGTVVGPSALGASALLDPSPNDVKAWAASSGVAAITVGRAARNGAVLSVDVRLREAANGSITGEWSSDVPSPDELAPAIDALARQVLAAATSLQDGGRRADRARTAPVGFDSKAPIAIHSSELEAFETPGGGGARRFVFTGSVEVTQDNIRLTSDRLEAFYPPNASQPEKLVATGHVVVAQGERRALCREATYLNGSQRVFCRGDAELRQGDDRAQGKEIELQLDTQRMFIRGGAQVRITPKPDAPTSAEASP